MKILFTGRGTSGSWKIRGVQVSLAIGAEAIPNATVDQMRSADIVVLVKRPTERLLADLRASGRPYVWDVVDSWPQPAGNEWDEKTAKKWLRSTMDHVQPHGVICATKQMDRDVDHACKTTVYHHARPEFSSTVWHRMGRQSNLERMGRAERMVGYEGGIRYLGRYEGSILDECGRLGWTFNPSSIAHADIAIALRDRSGYAARNWKSNVKLANAQALGIPALCSPESGYQETSTGGVLWIESPEDLRAAFDSLACPDHYGKVCAAVDAPPTLAQVSQQYLAFLERVAAT